VLDTYIEMSITNAANGGGVPPPLLLTLEQKGYVRQCVDVITLVAKLHGFLVDGWSNKGTYDHWINCAEKVGDPMKYVKWKISAFYSFHKGQELPPYPTGLDSTIDNPGVILGGRAYAYFNKVLKRTNEPLFESFITSVLYSKKGMPRPGKAELKLAEIKAFEKLTTPTVPLPISTLLPWADAGVNVKIDIVLSRETVESQIVRTIKEIFSGKSYSAEDRIKPFFPSTSANYINSRSGGGVVGVLLDSANDIMNGLKVKDISELLQLKRYVDGIEIKKDEIKVNDTSSLSRMSNIFLERNCRIELDNTGLVEKFKELYNRVKERAIKEIPVAKPLALAEALKTRVISKGPPYLYTVLKPLQKFMWSTMKKLPVFELIGTPVTPEFVQERLGKILHPDDAFLSVDYADATNEMFSWCSDAAVKAISKELKLDQEEELLFKNALTGHQIEYDGVTKPQTRGQLMGSIVSFPILCIINAAICRWSLELSKRRVFTLKDVPLAINGDDAVMKIGLEGKKIWEKVGRFCGLTPSVGKVYYSKEFLNINSTTYNFHKDGWEGYETFRKDGTKAYRVRYFQHVKYVNLGLLLSLKRSGGAATLLDIGTELSFGARCTQLIADAPSSLQDKVLSTFIHLNSQKLKDFNIPWFIPEKFGGIGLPSAGKFAACDKDLRLARKIFEHSDMFKLPSKPLGVDWQTYRVAEKQFPVEASAFVLNNDYVDAEAIDRNTFLGWACIGLLFTEDINSLYKPDNKCATDVANYYRKIQRTWKKALLDKTIKFPEPFNPNNYPLIYDDSNIPIYHLKSNSVGVKTNVCVNPITYTSSYRMPV